jgi:hypothetical protein
VTGRRGRMNQLHDDTDGGTLAVASACGGRGSHLSHLRLRDYRTPRRLHGGRSNWGCEGIDWVRGSTSVAPLDRLRRDSATSIPLEDEPHE